jgi:outer membrane scaffolding protein for murein synthesis (MipA/OmpV family)
MQAHNPLNRARFSARALVTAGLAAAALLVMPVAAQAQRASDDYFPSSLWQVGAGVAVSPKFEGSNKYEVTPFPIIAPAGFGGEGGVVQFRGLDDIRFRLLKAQGFEFGALTGYRFGRDSSDSAKLARFADIDGGLVLGAFAGYRAGSTFFSASYHRQVSGEDTGGIVRLMAEQTFRLDQRTKLVASLGTNIADKDYMQTFFGVTPAQAVPLPVYSASAGFKDVFAGLSATIDLDPRWTLYVSGRYSRLVGDAADSPIIDTSNQFYGGAGLTYKFDFGR